MDKLNIDDLTQCVSCEGYFETEKTQPSGDENMCTNCFEGFKAEIRQTGIDNLDEYLKLRNLEITNL